MKNIMKKLSEIVHEKCFWKTLLLTAVISVISAGVVFAATFFMVAINDFKLLDNYYSALPRIINERRDSLKVEMQSDKDNFKSRGAVGAEMFASYDDLDEAERMELIRDAVSAKSVSILKADGTIVRSTEDGLWGNYDKKALKDLLADKEGFEEYEYMTKDDQEKVIAEGTMVDPQTFIYYKTIASEDGDQKLVIEFDHAGMSDMYVELGSWTKVLERMLSGLDGYAFMKYDATDRLVGYPLADVSDEEDETIMEEILHVFNDKSGMIKLDTGRNDDARYGIITINGGKYLAMRAPMKEYECQILMAIPVAGFFRTSMLAAAILSLFIMLNLILFIVYIFRNSRKSSAPGIVVMVLAVTAFAGMNYSLEKMAQTYETNLSQLRSFEYEETIDDDQLAGIKNSYPENARILASAVARLMADHPELKTKGELRRLAAAADAEYIMLYDRNGQEIVSSNAYTGFSVSSDESDPSSRYMPVMKGYPYVVTEPAKDPITGDVQYSSAALISDDKGQADGFAAAVFDGTALGKKMNELSLVSRVNDFPVQDGGTVALVDEDSGKFIAHTRAKMIGQTAANYLSETVLGRDFGGFTNYNGAEVYLSEIPENGKDLLVMTRRITDTDKLELIIMMLAVIVLLIVFVFCPKTRKLCAESIPEQSGHSVRSPMMAFVYGYAVFFTILGAVAYANRDRAAWSAFGFVFGKQWSKGVHLCSIWSALFTISVLFCVVFVIHAILAGLETRVRSEAKTMLRITYSLVTYAAVLTGLFTVMGNFGVDTTTLIASAGILSFAVGMGAKDLVADILAGMFMIFEGQIHVGDIVSVGGWQGRVTDMGIRTTEITNETNDVKIINNSQIHDLVNMSRISTACTMDFTVSKDKEVRQILEDFRGYLAAAEEKIPELKNNTVLSGIAEITDEGYTVRVNYSCTEADKEQVTIKLRNEILMMMEGSAGEDAGTK